MNESSDITLALKWHANSSTQNSFYSGLETKQAAAASIGTKIEHLWSEQYHWMEITHPPSPQKKSFSFPTLLCLNHIYEGIEAVNLFFKIAILHVLLDLFKKNLPEITLYVNLNGSLLNCFSNFQYLYIVIKVRQTDNQAEKFTAPLF